LACIRVALWVKSVRRTVLAPNVMFCNALGGHTAGKCPLLSADRYGRSWPGRSLRCANCRLTFELSRVRRPQAVARRLKRRVRHLR